jgi:hypothetical protein
MDSVIIRMSIVDRTTVPATEILQYCTQDLTGDPGVSRVCRC